MACEKGYTEQVKIAVKTPLRQQTGDNNGQRPAGNNSESIKTDRGSFKVK